ncbi:MAG: succinate dehydrogenase, cytochrome b556 subunit [Albidovulum sp.]|nr:succinate dehydrogenase, cytochrome b556 subunit [Albidovulum sp.]
MASKSGYARPLSPHATIYRWPLNAVLSIGHRITGVGMSIGAFLVAWWFLAASISPDYFEFVDGLLTSIVGDLFFAGLLAALCFHFCTGIRHLFWDAGKGFETGAVRKSAIAGLAGAAALFALVLLVAMD